MVNNQETRLVFDEIESIRRRVQGLASSRDTGPALRRSVPVNFNQINHLQIDIEKNWSALPEDLRGRIRGLFNVRELSDGGVDVELK